MQPIYKDFLAETPIRRKSVLYIFHTWDFSDRKNIKPN